MCYDAVATPLGPQSSPTGVSVTLTSADGAEFAGYLTRPERRGGVGVLILPDNRGLSGFCERLSGQLAAAGHPALAYDYFGRSAGLSYRDRPADFPIRRHFAATNRDCLEADLLAAAAQLREEADHLVALGFCFGGRWAFFASAPKFGMAAVIGFYGVPGIAGPYGPGPTQHAAELSAPILGLFGGADEGIPATEVTAFDAALAEADVPHEIVSYPGAAHGFFEAGQDARTCADAWARVLGFLRKPR